MLLDWSVNYQCVSLDNDVFVFHNSDNVVFCVCAQFYCVKSLPRILTPCCLLNTFIGTCREQKQSYI